jgi:hypothetical protein
MWIAIYKLYLEGLIGTQARLGIGVRIPSRIGVAMNIKYFVTINEERHT